MLKPLICRETDPVVRKV